MNSVVNITTVGRHLTQFGLILYSNEPNSVLTLNKCESKQDILNATRDAVQPKKDTYTSKALQYSLQFFNAEHGGRKASKVPQILMVITDGEATDWPQLKQSSDELRKAGVTIISIGVEREKIEEQRKQLEIMAGGDSSKVFSVKNFKALEALYKNISSVLCNSTKPGKLCDGAHVRNTHTVLNICSSDAKIHCAKRLPQDLTSQFNKLIK